MPRPPLHTWFRFSLRTLFVVVTLACCWLAWEISIVRGRESALRALRPNPAFQVTAADDWAPRPPPAALARVSIMRRLLGDRAIQQIEFVPEMSGYSAQEHERLKLRFPEAQFVQTHPPYPPCHPGCFPAGTQIDAPA